MTKNLSLCDCISILKYYNKCIPNNIYKIKKKTNILLNKHICQFHNEAIPIYTLRKHNYLFTNTKRMDIKGLRTTIRNLSPNCYFM